MLSGYAVKLVAHVGPDGQEAKHVVHYVEDQGVLLWEVVHDVGEFLKGSAHDGGGRTKGFLSVCAVVDDLLMDTLG